jgi:glycosyltransferase involved in cell wall biosynthesis
VVGDGSQRGVLEAQSERLGLRNVRFAGAIAPSEIWRAYANADVYIQTPDIDNMPSSVLEAFSSGNPVVSTDAGGVPSIVRSGVNGLLAARDNDAALAGHVLRLLDTPGLGPRIALAALKSCERYRWPSVRSEWLSLYRELAEVGTPAPARVRHA